MKHRFLIVKNADDLTKQQRETLATMFEYLPQMKTLWEFARDARGLFEKGGRVQTLWRRREELLGKEEYKGVAELVEAMGMLEEGKFKKAVAFTQSEAGKKVRTNNHVERANRKIRFAEKVRYKWRQRKWVLRYVLLGLDRWWRQAAQRTNGPDKTSPQPQARAA